MISFNALIRVPHASSPVGKRTIHDFLLRSETLDTVGVEGFYYRAFSSLV